MAHRASAADKPAATITSLTEASLPETELWDTYATVYDLNVTVGDYTPQEHTITVPLYVTRLNITILDAISSGVCKVRISLNSGSSITALASIVLHPTTGLATTNLTYTRTWDITTDIGQPGKSFAITGLMNQYPKTSDVKIEALDSEGTPIFTRTLQIIIFTRGKIRNASTNLFTSSVDAIINFEGWIDDD